MRNPKDEKNLARRTGLAMVALGVVFAVAASGSAPRIWVWLFAAVLVCGGLAVWARNSAFKLRTLPEPERPDLETGRPVGEPVKLTDVPNLPLAEMLCAELRQNGIEAFYKSASPLGGSAVGLATLNPALPAEIWVGEADLERARGFLP